MVNLILVILSITLTAATLYASLSYLPGMTSTTDDAYHLTRYGFVALERAFNAATARGEGIAPAPTADFDGGIAANFSADYGYLPKAPAGYAWKYGFNGQDYYFCLYPAVAGASRAYWLGFNRAHKVLSDQQYFILPGGVGSCDVAAPQANTLASPPGAFPAVISMVYLLHWQPPAAPNQTATPDTGAGGTGASGNATTQPGGKYPVDGSGDTSMPPTNASDS